MQLGSWIDPENFNPGYLMRGMHLLPKRGDDRRMAAHPGLLDREGRIPGHRPGRPGVRVRLSLHGIAGAGVPSDQCVTGTISTLKASGDS